MTLNHFLVSKSFVGKQLRRVCLSFQVNQAFFEADSTQKEKSVLWTENLPKEGKSILGLLEKLLSDQHLPLIPPRRQEISSMFSLKFNKLRNNTFSSFWDSSGWSAKIQRTAGNRPGRVNSCKLILA